MAQKTVILLSILLLSSTLLVSAEDHSNYGKAKGSKGNGNRHRRQTPEEMMADVAETFHQFSGIYFLNSYLMDLRNMVSDVRPQYGVTFMHYNEPVPQSLQQHPADG